MKDFKKSYGPWALVTGASSGIGTEFARQLAERGLNLILVARREERLNALAADLNSKYSTESRIISVDLSRDDFFNEIRSSTTGLEVGLLINNAGFTNTGPLIENDLEDELRLLHLKLPCTI